VQRLVAAAVIAEVDSICSNRWKCCEARRRLHVIVTCLRTCVPKPLAKLAGQGKIDGVGNGLEQGLQALA
jgi:hypothetical protein